MPARRLVVELVGDASQLERTFTRSAAASATWGRQVRGASTAGATFSRSARNAEHDLGRVTRGALAGSGVFRGLGRSLAFASGAFLGVSAISGAFRSAIEGAASLEKANRSLSVVLRRNNQYVGTTISRLDTWAKAQQDLGVSQTQALQGLQKTVVLTGSVSKGMLAYRMALELSRAENVGLDAAMRVAGKAMEGQLTSLRRYGIILPKTADAQQVFAAFQAKFGQQAQANTDAMDRLRAAFSNVTTEIGVALLPVFERYANRLASWLGDARNQKRLTDDVTRGFHDLTRVLGDGVSIIRGVDRVTGSFVRTLEILVALKLTRVIAGWAGSLDGLAAKWLGVRAAAAEAGAAEASALGVGAAGGLSRARGALAGGAFIGSITRPGVRSAFGPVEGAAAETAQFRMRTAPFTFGLSSATGGMAALGATAATSTAKVAGLRTALTSLSGLTIAAIGIPIVLNIESQISSKTKQLLGPSQGGAIARDFIAPHSLKDFAGITLFNDIFRFKSPAQRLAQQIADAVQAQITRNLSRGSFAPKLPEFGPATGGAPLGPFGTAKPQHIFTQQFQLRPLENLAAAQAALTRGNTDDVAAAKQVVARIKRLIDQGRLRGAALIQALQAEGSALSTIWSAEDAAAQKRAAAAQAAKARIEAQIDPLGLEVALSKAEALGQPIVPALRALLAAAKRGLQRALATGNQKLEKEAYDQIASLKQQIKDAASQAVAAFTAPARLQLALARDQALGLSDTKDLLKLRKAILHFIATHKHNLAALTDAYNQLAQVNQELGSSAASALGDFKQENTEQLTRGLGLTRAQRKALRARLSQRGPGGTVARPGVGAGGYRINERTGRPIHVHTHINLDGKRVADNTTVHQQRHHRRNPRQRRGPHAGGGA